MQFVYTFSEVNVGKVTVLANTRDGPVHGRTFGLTLVRGKKTPNTYFICITIQNTKLNKRKIIQLFKKHSKKTTHKRKDYIFKSLYPERAVSSRYN